jgi:hypothetical protein
MTSKVDKPEIIAELGQSVTDLATGKMHLLLLVSLKPSPENGMTHRLMMSCY